MANNPFLPTLENKRIPAPKSPDEEKYGACIASLDLHTEGSHYIATELETKEKLIIRVTKDGFVFLSAPAPDRLMDMDGLSALFEDKGVHKYEDCVIHDYYPERKEFRFHFVNGDKFHIRCDQHDKMDDELKIAQNKWHKPIAGGHDHIFWENCRLLDQFIHQHHMYERQSVHAWELKPVLGDALYDLIHEVHNNKLLPAASASHKIKQAVKNKFAHASKHSYLYFTTEDPDDKRIFYVKDGHFGVVVVAPDKDNIEFKPEEMLPVDGETSVI